MELIIYIALGIFLFTHLSSIIWPLLGFLAALVVWAIGFVTVVAVMGWGLCILAAPFVWWTKREEEKFFANLDKQLKEVSNHLCGTVGVNTEDERLLAMLIEERCRLATRLGLFKRLEAVATDFGEDVVSEQGPLKKRLIRDGFIVEKWEYVVSPEPKSTSLTVSSEDHRPLLEFVTDSQEPNRFVGGDWLTELVRLIYSLEVTKAELECEEEDAKLTQEEAARIEANEEENRKKRELAERFT